MMGNSDYSERLSEAITQMVEVRGEKGVRADRHLEALSKLIREIFVAEGFDPSDVRVKGDGRTKTLPGYYRPTKNWDLLVVEKDMLAASIEFKSQMGSVGKNINNRAEESLGSVTDAWEAHRAGRFGLIRPWFGYFLILGEEEGIYTPVGVNKTVFPVDQAFDRTSYVDRYVLLCKRYVERRAYDAACLIVSTGDPSDPIREPDLEVGFDSFAAAIRERAKARAALRTQLS
jgi:hypothetical protein